MTKISGVIAAVMALMLGGCAQYQNVTTQEYATIQMVTEGEPFYWNDAGTFKVYDYAGGCMNMKDLGALGIQGWGETDPARIAVDKPLLFRVHYYTNHGANQDIDSTDFILIPENKKHYIIAYERQEVNDEIVNGFSVYMKEGDKRYRIPESRIKQFNSRDCM